MNDRILADLFAARPFRMVRNKNGYRGGYDSAKRHLFELFQMGEVVMPDLPTFPALCGTFYGSKTQLESGIRVAAEFERALVGKILCRKCFFIGRFKVLPWILSGEAQELAARAWPGVGIKRFEAKNVTLGSIRADMARAQEALERGALPRIEDLTEARLRQEKAEAVDDVARPTRMLGDPSLAGQGEADE